MTGVRIVADANVALRAFYTPDPQHGVIRRAVERLLELDAVLCVTPQVMREVYHTCMRPHEGNGLGFDVPRARAFLGLFDKGEWTLLDDIQGIHAEWRRLIDTIEIRGRQAHDANHAAALLAHRVTHLLTLDRRDFARYPGISVLNPDEVLAEGFAI